MATYKAIIFDFDNTLVDSTKPYVDYATEFLKNSPYSRYTVRQFSAEINTPTGTSKNIDKNVTDRFWAGLKIAMAGSIKPYPEDKDALDKLHLMGVKLGIVSRSTREKIERILKESSLLDKFQIIVDRAQKPDPQYLIDAINQLKLQVNEVLYVGDEQEDIELGKSVGTDTAYCLRNHEHAQETYRLTKNWLEQNNPTYLIRSILELADILKRDTRL